MKSELNRRKFIQVSSLASTSLFIPEFLKSSTENIQASAAQGRKLVIVQLSGGNDGLNTVVPFRNDIYYKERPSLAVSRSEILGLDDELGFNQSMVSMKKIFDEGYMSVINNVGYPNPSRSHFRSMDIWQTGSSADEYKLTGWLGDYLDSNCEGCTSPHKIIEVDGTLSLALKGKKFNGLAVESPALLMKTVSDPQVQKLATLSELPNSGDMSQLAFLYKTLINTTSSAEYIYERSKIYSSSLAYPANNQLAKKLKTVAELIISGIDTSVFYVSMTGFDTHIRQKNQHDALLSFLSDGLGLFCFDLEKNGKLDDTLIVVFSEFGRRVKENGSLGTDHGTASNMYIIGKKLKQAGIYNDSPDLSNLDEGDLKYSTDFRSVYATILDRWLGSDPKLLLGKQFDQLDFL